MDCAACTGFWWGLILHVTIGRRYDLSYLVLDHDLISSLAVGLCSLVMTPIAAGIMQAGLDQLGTVQQEPPSDA
jgi:hypothetical protein